MKQVRRRKSERPTKEGAHNGRSGRQTNRSKQRILPAVAVSAAGIFLPLLLFSAAALIPLLVFRLQDNIRCEKVVLGELENVDIASFNVGYEMNLYKRLLRFAEGKYQGNSYYAAAQELEPSSELLDVLTSDRGMNQTSFLIWIDNEVIQTEVFDYNLTNWKQYVIYGDDFSAGVNFILWYIELANPGTPTLKLLLDAETGDIYGISIRQTEETLAAGESVKSVLEESWTELAGIQGEEGSHEMNRYWYDMACWYGGMDYSALLKFFQEYYHLNYTEVGEDDAWVTEEMYFESINGSALINDLPDEEVRNMLYASNRIRWEISEDRKTHTYFFFYETQESDTVYELPFCCRMDEIMLVEDRYKSVTLRPGEFMIGFPDIYEWIPEFTESP